MNRRHPLRRHAGWRAWRRSGMCMACLVVLLGVQSGCEVACTREMTLAVQQSAQDYLQQTRDMRVQVENAKVPPYLAAVVKLRGLYGSRQGIDWRLLQARERQLALTGLLLAERDAAEDKMLAALITDGGVDPFGRDPFGLVPFALAFQSDRFAARLLVAKLRVYPQTRPANAVLCGLRVQQISGTLSALRAYCPCVGQAAGPS